MRSFISISFCRSFSLSCSSAPSVPVLGIFRYRLNSGTPMKDSINVSKENYLKAILEAEAEGREVIPAMLAHWLEVSAPAVTMALKRLKRDRLVKVGDDGIVRLTAAGRETAYRTALRHHLIERM